MVFMLMIGFAILGVIVSTLLINSIKRNASELETKAV